jgi:hypothetical protein
MSAEQDTGTTWSASEEDIAEQLTPVWPEEDDDDGLDKISIADGQPEADVIEQAIALTANEDDLV